MTTINIDAGWQLMRLDDWQENGWDSLEHAFQAPELSRQRYQIRKFPAQVHDVLLDHGLIKNPSLTGWNHDLWIDDCDWAYRCEFAARPELPAIIELGGVDTFADIWLNGQLLGSCNDAYLEYSFNATGLLKKQNIVIIRFYSAKRQLETKQLPAEYQGMVPVISSERVFRSGFHDYCGPIPTMIRCGLYAPVVCRQTDTISLENISIDLEVAEDLQEARIRVSAELVGDITALSDEFADSDSVSWQAVLYDPAGIKVARGSVATPASGLNPCLSPGDFTDAAGGLGSQAGADASRIHSRSRRSSELELVVTRPELWWPWTHGEPKLYTLELSCGLSDAGPVRRELGIRRVEQCGELCFYLNDQPVKLWGVNLAHPDTMTNCYNSDRMNRLLDWTVLANCNTIRVWGESEIYPEEFYQECDRRGLLVWQDFYLANSMYPEDPEYLALCEQEARQLVTRLRHHACILIWCGGNELYLPRDYSYPGAYCFGEKIVKETFAGVCAELDPGRPYYITSPYGGSFSNDPLIGDTHGYTHLWFVPGRKFPVFLSENCRVSTPPLRSMQRMMTDQELWPADYDGRLTRTSRLEWPASWNPHNTNEGYRKLGPVEHYPEAANAGELIYRIGAAHAEYLHDQVSRFRRGYRAADTNQQRRTMGHLLWRLNNNSNIISYGVIDYFLEAYYPYYELKRCYQPVLVSCELSDHAYIWITNDSADRISGELEVSLFHLEQNLVTASKRLRFELEPDQSRPICDLDDFGQFRKENIICARAVSDDGRLLGESLDACDIERRMVYPSAVGLEIESCMEGVVLRCKRYARCVELSGDAQGDQFGWIFEDNYFDLLPGTEKLVRITGRHQHGTISAQAYYDDAVCQCQI